MKQTRSDKSNEVYEYIQKFMAENGYSPSVRDIMAGLGFNSTATIQYYIKKLEAQGKIQKKNNRNRSLSLNADDAPSFKKYPLLGKVSAGLPILAAENVEDYYSLPQNLFRGEDLFLLRVSGDSMIGAGIFNGDLIIVNRDYQPRSNDIVVAFIDGEATVKRLFIHPDHITLHAENPRYSDLNFSENVSILGKVTGSIRQF